jgi:hypothetical protein
MQICCIEAYSSPDSGVSVRPDSVSVRPDSGVAASTGTKLTTAEASYRVSSTPDILRSVNEYVKQGEKFHYVSV